MLSNSNPVQLFDGVYMVVTLQDMLGLVVLAVIVLGFIVAGFVHVWEAWTRFRRGF
jgi:hypothetical protein